MRFSGLVFAAALPLLVMGCTESVDQTDDGNRGALGKADLYGSCAADDCGGKSSSGNCWCDDLCDGYGDCCSDKAAVCDDACGEVTCALYCENGFKTDENGCEICACNEPASCGGFANLQCPSGQICVENPNDLCDPANGGADCPGMCIPKQQCGGFANLPCDAGELCFDDPDDNCDPNNGGADCSGVCVPATVCGGFANLPCPSGQVCVDDVYDDCDPNNGGADCSGVCVAEPTCPDISNYCELACAGDPLPQIPDGCPIPKCDCSEPVVDSCTDSCGGKSKSGSCWCDNWCSYYGDCCADKADICS